MNRPTHRRTLFLLALAALTLTVAPFATGNAGAQESKPFANADFERVWSHADGPVASGQASRSWLWGPTPGVSLDEPFHGGQDNSRLVQYFDKARMELNSAVIDTTSIWRVSTGLLVTEMVEGRIQTGPERFIQSQPAQIVVAGDPNNADNPRYADFQGAVALQAQDRTGQNVEDALSGWNTTLPGTPQAIAFAHYVAETQHNIPDVFWSYMAQHGPIVGSKGEITTELLFDWLYAMGYPISEPYWITISIDGKPQSALIQMFQRRTLTYVPSFVAGWQVQMGNVGQHYYEWRYGGIGTPPKPPRQPTPSVAMPPLRPATGGFVGIKGSSFTYAGSEIKLKGTNYWLSQAPFVGTWSEWNGPRALQELEKAHQLGVNAIRIGIPYDHHDTMDVVWGDSDKMVKVSSWIRSQMTQLLQIASGYGMKVIFVLFEWYDRYPPPNTADERTNMAYLQGIVAPFANDDRVLAWDLHNEPDFYDGWQSGSQDEVIDWLYRMAVAVRGLDSRHPITVGVGNYSNLWYRATSGRTILSFVDFAAFHCYDAGALTSQIAVIKSRTDKPVLLEEMGWPTALGNEQPRAGAVFDEPTQMHLYKTMLDNSAATNIAGVFQWTLWDYWGGQTRLVPGHERYFGLVRQDGTFKPAADTFKNGYMARELPSDTRTNVPLDTSDKPDVRP